MGTVKASAKWKHDKKVFSLSKQIALDEKLRSTPVRVSSWELHLITNMAKEGIVTQEQSVDYLVNFLAETGVQAETYVVRDTVGMRTLMSIKTEVIGNILKGYGQIALSYLEEEVKRTSAADKNHLQALYYAIARVRESLKCRADEKVKGGAVSSSCLIIQG